MKTSNMILMLCSLLISSVVYSQEPLPHGEDFDNPNSIAWDICLSGNNCQIEGKIYKFALQSGKAVAINSKNQLYNLDSPVFDFSGLSELPTLSFDYENDKDQNLVLQIIVDGGTPVDLIKMGMQFNLGPQSLDNSNTTYLAEATGQSSVQFRFHVLSKTNAAVDNINLIPSTPPSYDIVYGYDAAGNRNSRSVLTVNFMADQSELSTLAQEMNFTMADMNDEELNTEAPLSQLSFQVYPNPTHQYINVNSLTSGSTYNILWYDATGKLLGQRSLSGSQTQFDLSRNAAGIYFIVIQSSTDKLVYKVIKE